MRVLHFHLKLDLDNPKSNSEMVPFLDFDSKTLVEFVRSKGFQEDVCNALTTSRISGYNIPDLVEKDFFA